MVINGEIDSRALMVFVSFILLIISACDGSGDSVVTFAGGHSDELDGYNETVWLKSDWWNGLPFYNGWCSSQINHAEGIMTLSLAPVLCHGQNYGSGECGTLDLYSYGVYATQFKASNVPGTVTAFFTYASLPHDEIDVEILGIDPTRMQVNYWSNGVEHPVIIDLGFDASAEFHTYMINWSLTAITWSVDGVVVHVESGSNGALPTTPGKIFANLWACDASISGWCGVFPLPVTPITASFDWIDLKPI
jgi:beta-glucanase (GH16 family)